jgi:threonine dehydrogenase-like Zn-dependent dehydrogenase
LLPQVLPSIVIENKREKTMRAAIFRKGEIVSDVIPDPVPRDGQVLVKTLACGICGSDLHARKHAHRMAEMARRSGRPALDPDRDIVFGHEYCCEIIEHGLNTEGRFKIGTRVCSIPALMSPKGAKSIGYSNSLVGGYAERMLLSE